MAVTTPLERGDEEHRAIGCGTFLCVEEALLYLLNYWTDVEVFDGIFASAAKGGKVQWVHGNADGPW